MFRCFLIRKLIQKENTDDKVFENKIYIKESKKRKEKIERMKYRKFVVICGTYLEESLR